MSDRTYVLIGKGVHLYSATLLQQTENALYSDLHAVRWKSLPKELRKQGHSCFELLHTQICQILLCICCPHLRFTLSFTISFTHMQYKNCAAMYNLN